MSLNLKPGIKTLYGKEIEPKKLKKIKGDASSRSYFRALFPNQNPNSVIIMQLPPDPLGSEEIETRVSSNEVPFINLCKYLTDCKIPVPKIYYYDQPNGLIYLEDLGDKTMEQILLTIPKKSWFFYYQKAILLLIQFQSNTKESSSCIAFKKRFGFDLLMWEFNHFLEYGIEARFKKKLSLNLRSFFIEEFKKIAKRIASWDYVLSHRDFQSRNLMIQKDSQGNISLRLIDFQDALMAPWTYDLVALLRDSYVNIDDSLLEECLHFYLKHAQLPEEEREEFRLRFDLVTIQRKLKDAGRFVYIDLIKGNPNFLPYIPQSLKYVKSSLKRNPEFKTLYEELKEYL
jgi:hypothetical protein